VAKIDPLSLSEKIVTKLGTVERIYISGVSLKVYCHYCATNEQKHTLLRSTPLDDTEILCSEPVFGFGLRKGLEGRSKPIKNAQSNDNGSFTRPGNRRY